MTGDELGAKLDVLNGTAAINGLTDGWAGLLEELKAIRSLDGKRLTPAELEVVVELQQEMQRRVR